MPFRSYSVFDTETLRKMTTACDAAVVKLGLTSADSRTGQLAAIIVALVADGVPDPEALCEKAILNLPNPPPSEAAPTTVTIKLSYTGSKTRRQSRRAGELPHRY